MWSICGRRYFPSGTDNLCLGYGIKVDCGASVKNISTPIRLVLERKADDRIYIWTRTTSA